MKKLEKEIRRNSVDGVLETVEMKGSIKLSTLTTLLELLRTKTEYPHHIEVAIVTGALVKTVDNETDALETIRRLETKH